MKPHHNRIAAPACALIAGALAIVPAHATPGSGFKAEQTFKGVYPSLDVKSEDGGWELELKTTNDSDVYAVRNSIAVGGTSGWHSHPGPSLITVTVGSITAYDSTDPLCSPKVYHKGQGFVDLGDHAHMLRNESGAPAETVAVQFLPVGADRRIDEPEPSHC